MTDRGGQCNGQAGPFDRFLSQSPVYREFLEASGTEMPESAGPRAAGELPGANAGRLCVELEIGGARFTTSLDAADRARPSVTLAIPSRVSRPEADDLQRCVRRVVEAAYPQRGLTPHVALVVDGGEVRLDLAKYWDGARYESVLRDSSPTAVIFCVQIVSPLPPFAALAQGPAAPDLMYAFLPAPDDPRELVSLSYQQARYVGADLAAALLQRHRQYTAADLAADAESLAQQLRDFCKAHAPPPVYY